MAYPYRNVTQQELAARPTKWVRTDDGRYWLHYPDGRVEHAVGGLLEARDAVNGRRQERY